jgi:Family of unknown function (DUF6236)
MANSATALFYPSFHFERDWAKAAILYWDSLARIVPKEIDHEVDDDDRIAATLVAEKLLVNIDPSDYIDDTAKRFDEYLVPLFEQDPGAQLDADYIGKLFSETARIHPAKLKYSLRGDLADLGVNEKEDGFYKVPSKLGAPYLLCLGTVMSEKIGVPLVTDDPSFEKLGEYFSFATPPATPNAGAAAPNDPTRNAMFRLGLPMPSDNQLWDVPLDKVLRFRENHEAERVAMRVAVESIMSEAEKIDDPVRLDLFWRKKKKEVDTAVKNYQRTMRSLNLMAFASLFKISIPTGVTTAVMANAGWLGEKTAMVLTGAAFAVDAAGWWGNRQFRKQQTDQKCPWIYSLKVRDRFGN